MRRAETATPNWAAEIFERRHDDGAEWRHDHEIHDDRKLNKRQQRDENRLVPRKAAGYLLPLVDRLGQVLFGHSIR
jgi:hypothetical protein